jgi:paraquat-inducible protein A
MRQYPWRIDIIVLCVASLALLAFGLTMPVLTFKKMVFWTDTYSIPSGIQLLMVQHDYILAAIVFFFSIVFPIAKLIGLFTIWCFPLTGGERRIALDLLGLLGKWSMLDVFVVAITVVIAKFGKITEARPREGIYLFASAVLLSMVLTLLIERAAKKHHFSGPAKFSI